MSEKVLEAKGIKKKFIKDGRVIEVLKGIDLSISKGDFVTIMGPSGAGKSTLLNILGTLDRPTEGEVIIEGKTVSSLDEEEVSVIRNTRIGFVFQFYHLLGDFSLIENVAMPLMIRGLRKEEALKRARRYLEMFGLENREDHRPSELSGGEQQRAAIARALITEPAIVLADEPTGNLDRKTGIKVIESLVEANLNLKETLVLVTHDPEIGNLGRRRFKMLDGEIFPL